MCCNIKRKILVSGHSTFLVISLQMFWSVCCVVQVVCKVGDNKLCHHMSYTGNKKVNHEQILCGSRSCCLFQYLLLLKDLFCPLVNVLSKLCLDIIQLFLMLKINVKVRNNKRIIEQHIQNHNHWINVDIKLPPHYLKKKFKACSFCTLLTFNL